MSNVEIRKNDSIRVFVELTSPVNAEEGPQEIEDDLVFLLESGVEQKVNLNAYSWNATLLRNVEISNDSTINGTERPIVIYGGLKVDSLATLRITPGTTLYFHSDAGIDVYGTLIAEGSAESNIVLRGDRTDWMFDYLEEASAPVRKAPAGRISVLYAGSLPRKKNAFLYTLAENEHSYDLELCGRGLNAAEIKASCVHYHGFVSDVKLIENDKFNYGLVWDGASLDECEGPYGEYLRFNNPLKASMYVRCHLPLIVWEKAAIAPLVRKKGIGICVPTLRNLDQLLQSIPAQQYDEMERNVIAWSKELKNGACTRKAFEEALEWLKENK